MPRSLAVLHDLARGISMTDAERGRAAAGLQLAPVSGVAGIVRSADEVSYRRWQLTARSRSNMHANSALRSDA